MHYYIEHSKMLNYECFNTIFGAVACAILEFQYRLGKQTEFGDEMAKLRAIAGVVSKFVAEFYLELVVPYEKGKVAENGDVGYEEL